MNRPTIRERFRYWFDGIMSHGTGAMLGLLGVVVVAVVAIDAIVVLVLDIQVGDTDGTQKPSEVIWANLVRTLDVNDVSPGALWAGRISMLLISIIGVFIAANLIGIISGAFDARVAELRKGRSTVLESNHTVILGWNSKIHSIVEGLCEANASVKHPAIVILATKDKVEMEDEMRDRIENPGRTKIICRSGNPLDQDDLLIANPYAAKSIIVLSDETGDDPDSRAIKTTLALTRHPKRPDGKTLHIVGQIRHSKNLEVATVVGRDEAKWILASEKVGQITAQTSRQPGLSSVYVELLNFGGDEIYFSSQPSLVGRTYVDAQLAFAQSCVMGVVSGGVVKLNPAPNTVYGEGDQLIVLAEDDSKVRLSSAGVPDRTAYAKPKTVTRKPEKTLILGANTCLPHILKELNAYAAKGSTVTVVSDYPVDDLGKYVNLAITIKKGNVSSRATLDALKPASFNHVIVVAYSDHLGVQEADTITLVTLLHLREIMTQTGVRINVVSEMLDDRNRKLAEVTRIDDFIVSDNLVSLMMSQVSENPLLAEVFTDLFDSDGNEIYLRPADRYITPGTEVDFYSVLGAASARGETALGYLESAADGGHGQVVVNPLKTLRRRYAEGDRIIVIAEH